MHSITSATFPSACSFFDYWSKVDRTVVEFVPMPDKGAQNVWNHLGY